MSLPTYDPELAPSLPPEVLAAAELLTEFFAERNIQDWAINGVCSRHTRLRLTEAMPPRLSSTL